jgi:hypothetical protein
MKNPKSECCNALVLELPKYKSYTMEDIYIIKVCSKCKNSIKL